MHGFHTTCQSQTDVVHMQVEVMRKRLPCAARLMSWVQEHGLAVHVLACALRQIRDSQVTPSVDWTQCQMQCNESASVFEVEQVHHHPNIANQHEI